MNKADNQRHSRLFVTLFRKCRVDNQFCVGMLYQTDTYLEVFTGFGFFYLSHKLKELQILTALWKKRYFQTYSITHEKGLTYAREKKSLTLLLHEYYFTAFG